MITSGLTLDDVLKIVQIAFYLIGTTLAILTYNNARKGILNNPSCYLEVNFSKNP